MFLVVVKWLSIVFGVITLVFSCRAEHEHGYLQFMHWFIIAMLAEVLIQLN